jgi:hypothetical protein
VRGQVAVHTAGPLTGLFLPVRGRARGVELAADMGPGSRWWPLAWVETITGLHVAWCTHPQPGRPLPPNETAWAVAARLGLPDLADRIGLNGDVLLVGVTDSVVAGDVPRLVVDAAERTRLPGRDCAADTGMTVDVPALVAGNAPGPAWAH